MRKLGLSVNIVGLIVSTIGVVLLFTHVTSEFNRHIQDLGSIALGYLGLIFLGIAICLTGIAFILTMTQQQ